MKLFLCHMIYTTEEIPAFQHICPVSLSIIRDNWVSAHPQCGALEPITQEVTKVAIICCLVWVKCIIKYSLRRRAKMWVAISRSMYIPMSHSVTLLLINCKLTYQLKQSSEDSRPYIIQRMLIKCQKHPRTSKLYL